VPAIGLTGDSPVSLLPASRCYQTWPQCPLTRFGSLFDGRWRSTLVHSVKRTFPDGQQEGNHAITSAVVVETGPANRWIDQSIFSQSAVRITSFIRLFFWVLIHQDPHEVSILLGKVCFKSPVPVFCCCWGRKERTRTIFVF
jgi:hypothetical protein